MPNFFAFFFDFFPAPDFFAFDFFTGDSFELDFDLFSALDSFGFDCVSAWDPSEFDFVALCDLEFPDRSFEDSFEERLGDVPEGR